MRILMLGWEFPPFISGGLGTACYGLTKALDRLGHEVLFVLPRAVDRAVQSHVKLLSPSAIPAGGAWHSSPGQPAHLQVSGQWKPGAAGAAPAPVRSAPEPVAEWQKPYAMREFRSAKFFGLPAGFASAYGAPESPLAGVRVEMQGDVPQAVIRATRNEFEALRAAGVEVPEWEEWAEMVGGEAPTAEYRPSGKSAGDYSGDLYAEAGAYARLVLRLARGERFDVVHAHDWLTFPAGIAVAQATGKPLIVHIHATEFDRSGESVNQRVYDIERRGMHAATRVVCVSEYTRRLCVQRYAADARKTRVVYNGIDVDENQPQVGSQIEAKDKIVLFLGRITMQKGPEYFIEAAKRVLEKLEDVKFVVAGSGDMATRMIELAAKMGIGHKVLFTGFLRGRDVQRVFEMADLFVMPSVSEPFGIAPLEAISHGTPVIISKQSGVSEVLTHALKVDFWDTEEMANKIVAVLRHPPLSHTLQEHGHMEIRKLTWDGAAQKCERVYGESIAEMARV